MRNNETLNKYIEDCRNQTLEDTEKVTMQVASIMESSNELALEYALPIFEVTQKELVTRKKLDSISNETKAVSYLFGLSLNMLKLKMAIDKTQVNSFNAPILKALFEESDEVKLQNKIDRYLVVVGSRV